jgi:uncharacterized protein (TIGR02231 family)
VFADRARVTRVRTAACEHGTAQAAFDRLPASLDVRTLRGDVHGEGELVGLSTDIVNIEEAAGARARGLTAEQQKIDAEIRAHEGRKAAAAAELEDLAAYANVLGATVDEEMRNPHPDTAAWGHAVDGLRARRASLDEERRKAEVALRGLRLQADKVARQLGSAGGGAVRAYRAASVTIGCRAPREVTAVLTYVIGGATWQPEYDLDFAPRARGKAGPGTARLTVGAVVRQTTGEDWQGVRLALSTARPKLGGEAPRPAPLLVDGYEQRRDKVLVQAQERREQLGGGGGPAAAGPSAAALDDKGNAFVLTLPRRLDVASDGRPVWSPVDVVEGPATAKLVATPKLDEHVYQVVALKNPAAYPLLDGRVRSYRGGSYVGDSQLRYQAAGEPFEVSLGIDEELRVERKTLDERDRDPAFLSSTKHIVRAYRVTVTNRSGGAETVELRENVPVSLVDDIRVELVGKQTTPGYAFDQGRGFLTWPVALKSGEQRTIDVGYAIHLPDSWQVSR